MFVSYVLRLRTKQLAEGRFVGEVEGVATGQRFTVRSIEQLIAFVLESTGAEEDAANEGAFYLDRQPSERS